MMKYIAGIIAFLFISGQILAASPSPAATSSATPAAKDTKLNQIDDLKERLATKVAELRTSQKKAIAGTVKSVTVSTITVETATNEVKLELTDDISVMQIIKGKRTKLTTDDLAKGDSVVVFGDYDSSLDLLKAKVIFIQSVLASRVSGTISDIDKKEYTITIKTPEDKSVIIDIEKYTLINGFAEGDGIIKAGFSKLVTGDTVHIVGTPAAKEANRMSGIRILDIGNMSGNSTPTPTPTTEPTKAASPSATVKTTPKKSSTPAPTR